MVGGNGNLRDPVGGGWRGRVLKEKTGKAGVISRSGRNLMDTDAGTHSQN